MQQTAKNVSSFLIFFLGGGGGSGGGGGGGGGRNIHINTHNLHWNFSADSKN